MRANLRGTIYLGLVRGAPELERIQAELGSRQSFREAARVLDTFVPAESAAKSLVNARMNKKRQMRWSPIGAHRVLQVRAAGADGRLKQAKLSLAA